MASDAGLRVSLRRWLSSFIYDKQSLTFLGEMAAFTAQGTIIAAGLAGGGLVARTVHDIIILVVAGAPR